MFLLYGLYRALGRPGMSVVLTVISLGTRVVLAYVLSAIPLFGVTGIWWAVPIGWFLADMTGFLYYAARKRRLFAWEKQAGSCGYLNWETGAVKELGVCACTFDTQTKELIWEPLYATLDQWSTQFTYRDMVETWPAGFEIPLSDGEIDILFEKPDGSSSVKESKTDMPSYIMVVEADQNGISIVHPPELFDQSFSATSYGALYQRVRDLGLPDLSAGDTDRTNSPELRQAASALFQAAKNGQPVSGDLWWSQENGDICLNFTFDDPISMSDGDQLTMRLALPEGA